MENKKGFIHADIEDKENSIDIDITINNLDLSMATAGLKGILDALSEHNKVAALFAWAKASCNAFGYKTAFATLASYKESDWQTEEKKEEGESEDE